MCRGMFFELRHSHTNAYYSAHLVRVVGAATMRHVGVDVEGAVGAVRSDALVGIVLMLANCKLDPDIAI